MILGNFEVNAQVKKKLDRLSMSVPTGLICELVAKTPKIHEHLRIKQVTGRILMESRNGQIEQIVRFRKKIEP